MGKKIRNEGDDPLWRDVAARRARTTNAEGIIEVEPDVLAHLNGGPTALSPSDIDRLMRNTGWTVDLVRFGNPKALDQIL